MTAAVPRLHAVTDDRVLALPDLLDRARALAGAGAVALHVRSRALDARRLLDLTGAFLELGAFVLVNDRADVARIAGVAGVHLPEEGLPLPAARRVVGDGRLVGRSAHDPAGARASLDGGANYVFLSPIWPTTSHPERPALGPDALRAVGRGPVIALGGVTVDRVGPCRAAGAHGVAALSALWDAGDPASAAREMLLRLE